MDLTQPPLSSKGQVQTVADQGRKGMQRQGRKSQDRIKQSWDSALVPPQGTHIMTWVSYTPKRKVIFLMLLLEMNIFIFCLFGPHQWYMEVPRLGTD